jgi:hypothetical protein
MPPKTLAFDQGSTRRSSVLMRDSAKVMPHVQWNGKKELRIRWGGIFRSPWNFSDADARI